MRPVMMKTIAFMLHGHTDTHTETDFSRLNK